MSVAAKPLGRRLFVGEAQLRAILDGIPARVALYDRERRHCYVNREYASFVGSEPEAILGRTLAEVMGPDTYALLEPFYRQLRPHSARALAGEASRWEGWLPFSAHNEPCFVQRLYMPYRGPGGAVDGYFVFARDLTELKRGEALNAAITASALDCIIVADDAGRMVEFNPAAERTFGYAREEALGRPLGDLVVSPALRAWQASGFRHDAETGRGPLLGRRIEAEGMRACGTVFPVELAIAEVRLADRRLFTAYLRDLTEGRAAAAEIGRQREALMQSEKLAAFGSLLAGVAHELNNPLSIVLAGALMLQEDLEAAAPDLAGRADRIRVAAERCARIVRSFLAMARQQKAERRPVAVAPLVDGALELLAYGLRSDGIEVEREVPAGLPPLLGDADQLHQVLANLITNARQAREEHPGPRRLRIAARAAGAAVEISVADSGPGIPDAIRGRVFDPFFTTKPVGSGTGVGLAVSRGIAAAHGGSLELAEPPGGVGTCFVLRLPRARPEDAAAAAAPDPAEAVQASAAGPRSALVVDDETEVAEVLAEILGPLGFRCDLAATGRQARRLLSRRDYDAVLCDLRMPDMGGQALYDWMERNRPHLCARTAFVTGDTLSHGAADLLIRKGRPVLEKPFVPREVRSLVASLTRG
jgi:PAS domain S-box-containing protein